MYCKILFLGVFEALSIQERTYSQLPAIGWFQKISLLCYTIVIQLSHIWNIEALQNDIANDNQDSFNSPVDQKCIFRGKIEVSS